MGLSLAEAAVRGTASNKSVAQRKQELLEAGDVEGLMALNKSIFGGFSMKAKDDEDEVDDDADDEDSEEDEDDSDEDEDDGDDEDDEDEDKGKRKKPDAKTKRIQELSAESKKHRQKASQRGKKIRELEAEVEQLKSKSKGKPKGKGDDDEDESDEGESEEATKLKEQNEKLQERLVTQQLRTEFTDLVTGKSAKVKFKNPKTAFKLLDISDVEIDEDGDIDGLEDAVKALAKSDPYLVDDGKSDDDEEDEDDEVTKRRKRKTGQPTGGRKKGNPNRDKLVNKYPALRR